MKSVIQKFQDHLKKEGIQITPKTSFLVACSGGPDSVCLLRLFCILKNTKKIRLAVAHFDHQIHKKSSEHANFTAKLCKEWGIPIYTDVLDVKKIQKSKKISLEEAARNARYDFFIKISKKHKFQYVALGHTEDDQSETVLMRILRGSGLRGIAAMRLKRKEKNITFLRPLLSVKKSEVEAALKKEKIKYIIDPTNGDNYYLRNKLRQKLIPELKKTYNSNFSQNLVALSNDAHCAYDFINEFAKTNLKKVVVKRGGKAHISIAKIKQFHPIIQQELCFLAVEYIQNSRRRITRDHLNILLGLQLSETGSTISLPQGLAARKSNKSIILHKS